MIDWISVKDRLPESESDFFVFVQYSYPHIQNKSVHVARYFPQLGVFAPLWLTTAVTHWAEIDNLPSQNDT